MTKEELKKEAKEELKKDVCSECFDNENDVNDCLGCSYAEGCISGYVTGAEPREKQIADLEKENTELREINTHTLSQLNLDNGELIIENETLRKENAELREELNYAKTHCLFHSDCPTQKENAELKKNYEDSLVACGVLKNKVDLLAQPSPLEAMQDVLITTQKVASEKQKEQLIKAKDLLNEFMRISKASDEDFEHDYSELIREAEQFLNEVEK